MNIFDAPDDEIVCWCLGVTKGQLCEAIHSGHDTLEKLQNKLGILQDHDCAQKSSLKRSCSREVVSMLMYNALCCQKKDNR